MLITFSGLDGAGKTTIIEHVKDRLNNRGQNCLSYTIYFDVSIYGIIRKTVSRSGHYQVNTNLKEARKKGLIGIFKLFFQNKYIKLFIIYLDSIIAWIYRIYLCNIRKRVLILDRYFYDFLIDLELEGINMKIHYKFLKFFYPEPSLSVYLDLDATEAWNRKHEYNIKYLENKRELYINIFTKINKSIVLYNDNMDNTIMEILDSIRNKSQTS